MTNPGSTSQPIEIRGLGRSFGKKRALEAVDLDLERGSVLGLIGKNGAGKTTLIRHVLGLLRAKEGTVRVFGRDPVRDPEAVLSRIGYVSEERDLPSWMRIAELLRYWSAFYPTWDHELAVRLCGEFQLDPKQKIRTLSRGQHVRTSLVVALGPRPPLLVLDEPSSGLDPVVRRDVLEAVVQTSAQEGQAVLFSSHLLDEVERMSDRLALIDHGMIVLDESLDAIRNRHALAMVAAPGDELVGLERIAGCEVVSSEKSETGDWRLLIHGDLEAAKVGFREVHGELRSLEPASLNDIFLAHTDD